MKKKIILAIVLGVLLGYAGLWNGARVRYQALKVGETGSQIFDGFTGKWEYPLQGLKQDQLIAFRLDVRQGQAVMRVESESGGNVKTYLNPFDSGELCAVPSDGNYTACIEAVDADFKLLLTVLAE